MRTKIVAMVLAAGAMLGAVTAFADEEKVGDYTWTYQIENGEAKIYNGESRATDRDPVGDIQIPAKLGGCPVTVVGNGVLASCYSMTSVTMPKSVRVIEGYAFISGSAISNVTFSVMTTSIGKFAFNGCRSLKSLVLPNNVADIASHVFYGCTGITNLTVGVGTKSIGAYAFYGCSSLVKASLPRTLEAAVDADPTIFGGCADGLKIEYYDVVSVAMDANGGVGGGDVTVRKGGTLAGRILPAATREGYAFAGWYTKKSGGKKLSTKTKFAKGARYYAHWTSRKYPVKLAKSGKGSVSGAGKKAYRSKATVKAKAAKGYVFQGWYKITNNGRGIVNSGQGNGETLVSQKTTYAFKVPLGGVTLKARFITKAQDKAAIGMTLAGTGVGASAVVAGATLPVITNMCGVALKVPLTAAGLTPVKVTVKGLPKGLKYNAKKKVITGVPSSARTFTVKFTVKSASASRTWSVKWVITPLPDWAKGNFIRDSYIVIVLKYEGSFLSPLTLSVTSSGKISGKLVEYGTNWTLNASSYDMYVSKGGKEVFIATNVTATYAYKVTKKVKGKDKKVTKYITRNFMVVLSSKASTESDFSGYLSEGKFYVKEDEDGGIDFGGSVSGEGGSLSRDPWSTDYKALGRTLFYTSKKKKFRTFKIAGGSESGAAIGLSAAETLTLKITPSGDVTAAMAFDTGRTTKNKKTGKKEKVIYTATNQTVLMPVGVYATDDDDRFAKFGFPSAPAGSLVAVAGIYFAPNEAYGYPGYSSWAPDEVISNFFHYAVFIFRPDGTVAATMILPMG